MFWQKYYDLCINIGSKPNPVGKQLGIASSTITQWKQGALPSGDSLIKIADYFDCSTDYLLGRTANPEITIQFATTKEQQLLEAYRAHPELQLAIDRLLGIDSKITEINLAASDGARATIPVDNETELLNDTEELRRKNGLI